jgi:hypothetical protein
MVPIGSRSSNQSRRPGGGSSAASVQSSSVRAVRRVSTVIKALRNSLWRARTRSATAINSARPFTLNDTTPRVGLHWRIDRKRLIKPASRG